MDVELNDLSAKSFAKSKEELKMILTRTSLVVQWSRLGVPNAGGTGSNPGCGTKLLHAMQYNLKKKKPKLFCSLQTSWKTITAG